MPAKISFHVNHVSGQDDNYKAVELNTHSPTTKGWQSSRFCLYPQDIVLQLDRRVRLRKIQILSHQYLIATKIEFYVGDVPDGTPHSLQNARYTRLGYVALSGNEKTGFKARELKSVHVDAMGLYVKFVIHKNHINKHNLYNQVGIVALNVIGDDLDHEAVIQPHIGDDRLTQDPSLAGLFNRPDYISPLDDLAFDMYQDPEVAQIIRKLEKKKQEAVLQERYDYAKKLKYGIAELQKVGEKLGKFEVEKRQAVENEDYDKAKLKKVQMDEYRLQVYKELEIHDLLEVSGPRHHKLKPVDLEPERQPTPPKLPELSHTPVPPPPENETPRTPYDERPLPAIKKSYSDMAIKTKTGNTKEPTQPVPHAGANLSVPVSALTPMTPINPNPPAVDWFTYNNRPIHHPKDKAPEPSPTPTPRTPHDEVPIPAQKGNPPEPELDDIPADDPSGNVTGEPEPMSEKDQREAANIIDVFGLPLASKAYSKTWSFREDALLEVYKQMSMLPPSTPKDESKAMLRSAILLIVKGIKDKVFAVYKAALNLLKMILTEYVPKHKIPKQDTAYTIEKTLVPLLQKTGDTTSPETLRKMLQTLAVRNRDTAKTFIIEESKFEEVRPLNVVTGECVKPFKLTIAPRLGLSRTELVDQLYKDHKLQNSGLTVENIMKFCTQALEHTAGEVREKAERIIVMLYKDVGAPVKDFLPPDDDKTRKNVLYKQLFEAFDKIDGKPSKEDMKKQKQEQEAAKQKEIDALQAQLQQLKDMAAGKAPTDQKKEEPKPDKSKEKKNKQNKKDKGKSQAKTEPPPEDDISGVYNIDSTCIFCGEKNEAFTEEGLDMHYWKSCPMLKRCAHCKQVVEIAGLTDHLLTECDAKDTFAKDPRCTEAIPKSEYDQHIKEKSCNPAESGKSHCPLCHQNIPSGEDGWKNHLMGRDGCKQNPRRQQALNKQGHGGGAKGATKGKAGASQSKGRAPRR